MESLIGSVQGRAQGRLWCLYDTGDTLTGRILGPQVGPPAPAEVLVVEHSAGVLGQRYDVIHARYPAGDWGMGEAQRHVRLLVTQAGGTLSPMGQAEFVVWHR